MTNTQKQQLEELLRGHVFDGICIRNTDIENIINDFNDVNEVNDVMNEIVNIKNKIMKEMFNDSCSSLIKKILFHDKIVKLFKKCVDFYNKI